MDDIFYRINKIKMLLEDNKKILNVIFDKYFTDYVKQIMKKIIINMKEEKNYFKYILYLAELLSDIYSELNNKYVCDKNKLILDGLKKNLKKLFIAVSIKYSSDD